MQLKTFGTPQSLPSGFNSTDRASMATLKNGLYWHTDNDGALNFPSGWGFLIKFGIKDGDDFSALYFAQPKGSIYKCSGNMNSITGWLQV